MSLEECIFETEDNGGVSVSTALRLTLREIRDALRKGVGFMVYGCEYWLRKGKCHAFAFLEPDADYAYDVDAMAKYIYRNRGGITHVALHVPYDFEL